MNFLNFMFFVACVRHVFSAIIESPETKAVYVGCYDAWDKNTLQYTQSFFVDHNNLETCSHHCRQPEGQPNSFTLLKGKYCNCLDWDKFHNTKVDDRHCQVKCPGDEHTICGGNFAFSVYCLGEEEGDCSRFIDRNHPESVKDESSPNLPHVEGEINSEGLPQRRTGIAYTCVNCSTGLTNCITSSINPSYDYIPGNTPALCAEYCGRPITYYYHGSGSEVVREPTTYAFAGWDTRYDENGRMEISICKCSNSVLDNFEEVDPDVCTKKCPERHDDVCGGPDKGVFSVYYSRHVVASAA